MLTLERAASNCPTADSTNLGQPAEHRARMALARTANVARPGDYNTAHHLTADLLPQSMKAHCRNRADPVPLPNLKARGGLVQDSMHPQRKHNDMENFLQLAASI